MPSTVIRSAFVACVLLSLVTAGRSVAQEVAASAVVLSASHLLPEAELYGGAVALRWRTSGGAVTYHVGGEWTRGSDERIGSPCAGLIPPGTCGPERVRDESRLYGADAGAAIRVLDGGRAALALTADVTLASVRHQTRGLASSRTLAAEKRLWGGRVGAEARWEPWMRVPLAVELGVTTGQLGPFSTEVVYDGYTPFNDAFRVTRLRVGLVWRLDRLRRQGAIRVHAPPVTLRSSFDGNGLYPP